MDLITILLIVVNCMLGVILYANDYFDDISQDNNGNPVDALTFILFGVTIVIVRVARNTLNVFAKELEGSGIGEFITAVLNALKSFFAWLGQKIKAGWTALKREFA